MPQRSTIEQLQAARSVGTPLACIRTADPAGTIEEIRAAEFTVMDRTGKAKGNAPLLVWDLIKGLRAMEREGDTGEPSKRALGMVLQGVEQVQSNNPAEFLTLILKAPPGTIVIMHNAQRFIDADAAIPQAVWNLRDDFKMNMRMLVMLCPSISLPSELTQDVLMLDEPLPDEAALRAVARKLFDEVGLPAPDEATQSKIVDATLGLATFPSEQAMAMSLTEAGIDLEQLWDRKRSVIDGNPGLSVWRGKERFSDIGGCANIKQFLTDVIAGEEPPRAIVFVDEIEKGIGSGQDTSGTSQAQMGQLLTFMQDNDSNGLILVGVPGTAKSAISKAAGREAEIPTIALDLGGTKNSLVGESEARLRNALKVIDAVSQKRALWIATSNSVAIVPPELKRRFTMGIFYFDLPTEEERAAIWAIYRKKYAINSSYELPDDTGWTGAEIKQCCSLAWRLRRNLIDASAFVVPVSRAAPEIVERLRTQADGKFISVSYPGTYRKAEPETVQRTRRAVNLQGVN